jgi:predicted benzoate:H+ symporter BenE
MNPDIQKELLTRLDTIASKMGITAGFLWQVMIREIRIEAIEDTIIAVLFGASLVALYLKRQGIRDWADEEYSRSGIWAAVMIYVIFALGITWFYSYYAIGEWLNPSYFALMELLDKLK